MGIFDNNINIRPYKYPHLIKYAQAIHQSFWLPEHFTYDRDVHDFKVNLSELERNAIKRSMLAISVVENRVKSFWSRLDMRMPHTEVAIVGQTFGSNECIHQLTYEKLLILLGLESEFDSILEVPCMRGRSEYLGKYLKGVNSRSDKDFTKSLILFTLLVENASLFSQFLIVASFNKYKNSLTNFSSVIGATAREEQIHAKFGESLIRIIKEENPDWFDSDMETKIRGNVRKAFEAECSVLDWIFESGELDFLPKQNIQEYLKYRFNKSLNQIGYSDEFNIDQELLEVSDFFEVQISASNSFDFFNEKSSEYSQNTSFDEDTLWEN